jgi:hypothetical protein
MCKYFSFMSDSNGKLYYLNFFQRLKAFNLGESPDSHSYIAEVLSLNEDRFNKWEYDPKTDQLQADCISVHPVSEATVLRQIRKLNFKFLPSNKSKLARLARNFKPIDFNPKNWLLLPGVYVKVVSAHGGWGNVKPGDIGRMKGKTTHGWWYADFPRHKDWVGKPEDFKLLTLRELYQYKKAQKKGRKN